MAVGANAKISVAASKALTYQNTITPAGSVFNPILGAGATCTMNGASIVTSGISGNSLAIGDSNAYNLTLVGTSALTLNAGALTPITLYSTLLGSGTLIKTGAGDLILNNIGASYTGPITLSAGKLILNGNYSNNSTITAASGSTVVMDLASSFTNAAPFDLTSVMTGAGNFTKRGAGTMLVGTSGKIDGIQGTLTLEKGRLQLRNTGLHASSSVVINGGASLDVVSTCASATTYALNSVTIGARGALRILRENPAGLGGTPQYSQTSIATLNGVTGSVIGIQVDSSLNNTLPAAATAPLKIATLSAGTDRIFLQVRPIAAGTTFAAGAVFPLIQADGGTTLAAMAARLRLMPSIAFSSAHILGETGTNSATLMHGNLFVDGASGDSNTYGAIYMKVNSATGRYNTAIFGGSSAALPSGGFFDTAAHALMGNLIGSGNIPWYSALDQFLTSQVMSGGADWTLASPLSQVEMNSVFSANDFAISSHTSDMFSSQGRQQHMLSLLDKDSLSVKAKVALQGQGMHHQNLKTDSKVSQKGSWKGWTNAFEMSGLTVDHNYHQEVKGSSTGVSCLLSGNQTMGYQLSNIEQSYKALTGLVEGSVKSQVAQGNSYTMLGNMQLQTNVIAAQHDIKHKRDIIVEMEESYINEWTASSSHGAQELRVEQVAMMDRALSSEFNVSAGARYEGQYTAHEGYTETGAEDLNLRVQDFSTSNHVVQPLVGVSYHQAMDSSWIYMRATAGYQHSLASKSSVTFGFDAYSSETAMPIVKLAKNAYTLGFEAVLGSTNGFSIVSSSNLAYRKESKGCEYQSNVSMIWEF